MIIEKFEKMNNFLMKNILVIIAILILLYLFMGFSSSDIQPMPMQEAQYDMVISPRMAKMSDSSPMMLSARNYASTGVGSSEKIVKNFALSIESSDVEKAKSIVEDEVKKLNGLLDNFYSYNYSGNELAYNFSIRIPADKSDEAIEFFKTLGIIKSESSSAANVSEEYSDNKEKLKNLYLRRDRLREMMKVKTQNLSDVIAVDRELNNVQNSIDMLENANKKIDSNVSYSRIDLSIIPEVNIDNFNNSQWRISTSWKSAVNSLITFGQKSVDYGFKFITFLPVIIIVIILLLILKTILQKIFAKNN